jgi:hypothetical protein
MVTLLTASFLLLTAFAIVVYYLRKSRLNRANRYSLSPEPPRFDGLFAESNKHLLEGVRLEEAHALRESLFDRATKGDRQVLAEAVQSGDDRIIYDGLLNTLIASCDSDRSFFALVSYVARNEELKVTTALAERFIESWKRSAERLTTAEMLHVAALSDDAALYERACQTAITYWQEGRLPNAKPDDLLTLIEGEYWILSAGARSSGAGFVLKRSISDFRKQLVSRNNT